MFRSYQTILRELLCLVVKLCRAAYLCTSLVMWQHAFSSGLCAAFVVDMSVVRTGFVLTVQNQSSQQHTISECFKCILVQKVGCFKIQIRTLLWLQNENRNILMFLSAILSWCWAVNFVSGTAPEHMAVNDEP